MPIHICLTAWSARYQCFSLISMISTFLLLADQFYLNSELSNYIANQWTSFYMRTCLDACRKYTVLVSYADSNFYIKKVIQI